MLVSKPDSRYLPWLVVVQIIIGVMLILLGSTAQAAEPRCLYVSSYHKGYPWSDGVEQGLRRTLTGHCELRQFDMDTKRNKSAEFKQEAAAKARSMIEEWKPNVVITSDDNAAKYLIKPFYKDSTVPFVFSGVNWTVEEYGFPYSNVTGIVEIAPIRPLLERAMSISGGGRKAMYIGADTLTEDKNFKRYQEVAQRMGIDIESRLVANTADWIAAYGAAQEQDFIVVGSKSGINDWSPEAIRDAIVSGSSRLSITVHDWMMPFTMLGFTKIPEEQGEWAGKSAIAILRGTPASAIPIVTNRKWDIWVNDALLKSSGIDLPGTLSKRAKKADLP